MSVVHRVYARAVYVAAREKGRVAQVREGLAGFAGAVRDVPELRSLLRNPQLDPRAKTSALDAIVAESDELVGNFLRLLIQKGRIAEIEQIQEEVERLAALEEGQLSVELTTAYELTDKEARAIVAQIETASGRRVEASRKVDPDLIGGIVLQAGSLRLDASLRGRLERLRQELATVR